MNLLIEISLMAWLCIAAEGFSLLPKRTDTKASVPSSLTPRPKMPQNNTNLDTTYWSRNDIHTIGNIGVGGSFHAAIAPLATKVIDTCAYDGKDVRSIVTKGLRQTISKPGVRIVDLCCGVGISTRALQSAFQDAELIVGFDTSPEMIKKANAISSRNQSLSNLFPRFARYLQTLLQRITKRKRTRDVTKNKVSVMYRVGNSENVPLPSQSFDLVSIMYAFHEIPVGAREQIMSEAHRILKPRGTLAILDIDPTYTPSKSMLLGEPYIMEYRHNIDRQLAVLPGFSSVNRTVVIPGQVILWILTKS